MERNVVLRQIEAIVEAIEGVKSGVEVSETTRPITDLGLQSIDGLDCVLELEDKFGVKLPDGFNPFVNDEKKRAMTLGELTDHVVKHLDGGGAPHA